MPSDCLPTPADQTRRPRAGEHTGIPPVALLMLVYQLLPAGTSRAQRNCSHMEHTQDPWAVRRRA